MKITDNVIMLESSKYARVFLVRGEENILIDTGMPGRADKIIEEINSLGVDIKSIKKILLTHHDVDHIGSAKALQEASGAEIWAPALDVPYITGEKKRPGMKRFVSLLMKAPKPVITGTYDERQEFDGIEAIHTPGHTPGHTILKLGNIIFAGDLLGFSNGRFNLLAPYMNWDMTEVRYSIKLVKTLDFDWLCPAHNEPAQHDAALDEFLESVQI